MGTRRVYDAGLDPPHEAAMKILIADKFQNAYLSLLEEAGHEVSFEPELNSDDLENALSDHEMLIVRSTRVTGAAITASESLQMVVRAGAGTNTIDKVTAARRGVYVCNTPGKNALAVAELAFGLLLAIDRNIPDNVADLRAGRWNKKKYAKASGLYGRKIGIVGLGEIGMAMAERAAAFGLKVFALARPGRSAAIVSRAAAIDLQTLPDLSALAGACDILSFHVPANSDTAGMIGREFLSQVGEGTIILNTSRGQIVDEAALIEAMDQRGLRAGLDVYCDEPGSGEAEFTSALAQHPQVYGTHHIGASTQQSQDAIAAEVVEIVRQFEAGTVLHCVNMERRDRGSSTIFVRHYSKVGVLASVFEMLKIAGLNVEQMSNQIFAGGEAATATLSLSGHLDPELLLKLDELTDVIAVSFKPNT